jgi:hypothetical protein
MRRRANSQNAKGAPALLHVCSCQTLHRSLHDGTTATPLPRSSTSGLFLLFPPLLRPSFLSDAAHLVFFYLHVFLWMRDVSIDFFRESRAFSSCPLMPCARRRRSISFLCTVLVVGGNPFARSSQLLARQASAQDAHTTLLVARLRLCGGKRPSRAMGGNAAGAPGRVMAQELLYEHTLKEAARAKVAFCHVPLCLQNEPRFVR